MLGSARAAARMVVRNRSCDDAVSLGGGGLMGRRGGVTVDGSCILTVVGLLSCGSLWTIGIWGGWLGFGYEESLIFWDERLRGSRLPLYT